MRKIKSGPAWAYLFLAAGLGASLAANVAASYLGHDPSRIDLVLAGAPPLALFGAVEVLARNPWPVGKENSHWTWIRRAGAFGVAIPAAVVSYVHLFHLVTYQRTDERLTVLIGVLTPLMIDGLLGLCTAALLIPNPQPEVETSLPGPADVPRLIPREVVVRIERPRAAVAARAVRPVATATARSSGNGAAKQRFRPTEHPLWPDYVAAGRSWTVAQMQDRLALARMTATPAAARSLLARWDKVIAEGMKG